MNNKKLLLLIITLVLLFNNKSFSDESSDNIKKVNYIISFYAVDQYNTFFDYNDIYSFKKNTELDLTYKYYFLPFYSFIFYFNNIFEFDFVEIYRLYKEKPNGYIDNKSIYNTFTFELSNEFTIKKHLTIDLNFDLINDVSSNKYLSVSLVPWIKLSGNYYFGYFWQVRVYQFFEFLILEDYDYFTTSSYLELGYQFFRFYGPKNFKFSILFDDEFYYYIPTKYIPSSIDNTFRFGLKFDFFNFEPFVYFRNDINYYLYKEYEIYNYNGFGIDVGLKYTIKNFTIVSEYIGKYDIISNDIWLNEIDFYFKFNIIKSN